jgi:hypothetical protein
VQSYDNATAVTKSDSTVYAPPLDALFIGGAGNVAVLTPSGTTLTITGVLAGVIYPIACTKVMSTNTTATNIVGLRYGPRA